MKNIKDRIKNSKNILLILPENPKIDFLSTCFAFALILENQNKNIKVYFKKDKIPSFLNKPSFLIKNLSENNIFSININTKNIDIDQIHYEKNSSNIKINLKTKKGKIKSEDLDFETDKESFDFIISFIPKNNPEFKNIYTENSNLFKNIEVAFINPSIENLFNFSKQIDKNFTTLIKSNFLYAFLFKEYSFLKNDLIYLQLKKADFELLHISSKILFSDIINLYKKIPKKTDFIILIDPPVKSSILALFLSKDKNKINKLAKKINTDTLFDDYILFSTGLNSIQKAKKETTKLILDL